MTKTSDDLSAAFAGESQARNRYIAFAKKADAEGYHQVARLFRAAADSEMVHAQNHFRAMDGVKSTADNLQTAINGENYEVTTMYPAFMADAQGEGVKRALGSFKDAWEVEKVHEGLYREALANLGKEDGEYDYYVCPVCGYTHARSAPDQCPVCGTLGSKFMQVK